MEVTVQVAEDTARSLHQLKPPSRESEEILTTVEELDVVLEAVHPGTDHPFLIPFFKVALPDPDIAEQFIKRLQACEAVEAAYIKPPDALP